MGARAAMALLLLAGCASEVVQYQYRPSFMRQPGDPDEITLPDGTRVVYVDQPIAGESRMRPTIGLEEDAPEPVAAIYASPGVSSPSPEPEPDVKPFELRETAADGTVTLRAMMPAHVISHLSNSFREREWEPLYRSLLAAESREAWAAKGGLAAFTEWCERNRGAVMATVTRMGFELGNSQAVVSAIGHNGLRLRLSPKTGEACPFKELDMRSDHGNLTLIAIR